MLKGVFDTKANSGYDDEVAERYHFPSQYLERARQMVGDWVLLRETQRNGGRRAYVAVAQVARLRPDDAVQGHTYADLASFLPFDRPVPLKRDDGLYRETILRTLPNPQQSGAYLQGKSVRTISEEDFAAVVREGLEETLSPTNATRPELEPQSLDLETLSIVAASREEQERRVQQVLLNRKIRDASFRLQICEAYGNRCAVTGLRMVDGGGKAEVQAAHIWPVADGGPDVVQNGIALSATVHWLFDRHLISVTEDFRLLISHNRIPRELQTLFAGQMARINLPQDRAAWPRAAYLAKHLEVFASKA